MVDKAVSTADLLRFQKDGAELHFEKQKLEVENFPELIEAMKAMVGNDAARIAADSGRYQSMLEVMATLQVLVRKSNERPAGATARVDTKIVEQLLEQIRVSFCTARPLVGYDFEFNKDQRGFTRGIKATPFIVGDPETRKY